MKLVKQYFRKGLKPAERSRIWYAKRVAENVLMAGLEPGFNRVTMTLVNRRNPNGFTIEATRDDRNKAKVTHSRMLNSKWAQDHGYANAYYTHTGFPRGKRQRQRAGLSA